MQNSSPICSIPPPFTLTYLSPLSHFISDIQVYPSIHWGIQPTTTSTTASYCLLGWWLVNECWCMIECMNEAMSEGMKECLNDDCMNECVLNINGHCCLKRTLNIYPSRFPSLPLSQEHSTIWHVVIRILAFLYRYACVCQFEYINFIKKPMQFHK